MHETLIIDGIPVNLVRKKVKNLNIRVKPDGTVWASAPKRMSKSFIEGFIRSKRGWIDAARARYEGSLTSVAEAATDAERAAWKAAISAQVPLLVEKWQPIIGVKAGKLAYRNMKSRWGSCQPETGRICINTRLALYPPECLEYVVVHELCHLRERGHGPRFKALMDEYLPDWHRIRAELK